MQKNLLFKKNPITIDFPSNIKQELIEVLSKEAKAINYLVANFPKEAEILAKKIMQTFGKVVLSGMGKSGHIAKKLAATFSSTGTPSFFLHPAEALHGDLGMVQPGDFFIAFSKSGTGKEFEQILPILKSQGIQSSLICCNKGILSSLTDLVVVLPFKKEACALNLAPTSSSTLMMAFGDALAIVVSKLIGFTKTDFARFHPAGALGKRLLLTVNSFMYSKESLPLLDKNDSFVDLIFTISSKKLGTGIVVDEDRKLLGIITDGDLRRACSIGSKAFDKKAEDIMHKLPKTIPLNSLAFDALKIMEDFNITSLIVMDEDKVEGLVHIHDLVKAGIKE